MGVLRQGGFLGENRALHPMLLSDMTGVKSLNQKVGRGDLRPWSAPLTVAAAPADTKTIYRMGRDEPSDSLYWLTWPSEVHAVRGPNAVDLFERTYFTGSGTPKWTDSNKALAALPYPMSSRELGVPAPASALLLSSTVTDVPAGSFEINSNYTIVKVGTTDFTLIGASANTVGTKFKATGAGSGTGTASNNNLNVESRYYVYTYVTDADEESAPSPPSIELICRTDADNVQISNIIPPPSGNYGINRVRIYRTQSGQSGDSNFYFLLEQLSTVATAVDDGRDLAEALPTTDWITPPADLRNLTAMWNGMLAGISGRSIRFCEAYAPYSWPIKYEIVPTMSSPVALAVFGQFLVVLTDGSPILVTGGSPDAMDEQPSAFLQSCVAPRSAVGLGHGVAWASPDGLCYISSAGPKIVTQGIMTRDNWQALKPETIQAGLYENRYIATYEESPGVRKGFMWDPEIPNGLFFLDFGWDAMYFDLQQDALYLLDGLNIKKWDSGAGLMTTFRSKIHRNPKPITAFACGEVVADAYPVTVKIDAVNIPESEVLSIIAAKPILTSPTPTSVRYTVEVNSRMPFRLPSGFIAQDYQIEVTTANPVQAIAIAHSIGELAQT